VDEDTGEVLGELDPSQLEGAGVVGASSMSTGGPDALSAAAAGPVLVDLGNGVDEDKASQGKAYVGGIAVTAVPEDERDDWLLKGAAAVSCVWLAPSRSGLSTVGCLGQHGLDQHADRRCCHLYVSFLTQKEHAHRRRLGLVSARACGRCLRGASGPAGRACQSLTRDEGDTRAGQVRPPRLVDTPALSAAFADPIDRCSTRFV
jgi:hypothetical protein